MRAFLFAIGLLAGLTISASMAAAWTGPTGSPPNNNVSAPVNVGTTNQVKSANLGINGLAVFGNSILDGTNGDGNSNGVNSYLNFGATSGSSGYGIRDNVGTLEFKNLGGSWSSIQNTIYALCGSGCGGGGQWVNGTSNSIYYTAGNVGIGVTSPTDHLTVSGPMEVTGNTSSVWNAASYYSQDPGGETWAFGYRSGTGFSISDETQGAVRFWIDSTGAIFDANGLVVDNSYNGNQGLLDNSWAQINGTLGVTQGITDNLGATIDANGNTQQGLYVNSWGSFTGAVSATDFYDETSGTWLSSVNTHTLNQSLGPAYLYYSAGQCLDSNGIEVDLILTEYCGNGTCWYGPPFWAYCRNILY